MWLFSGGITWTPDEWIFDFDLLFTYLALHLLCSSPRAERMIADCMRRPVTHVELGQRPRCKPL